MVDGTTEFFPAEEVFDAPSSVASNAKQNKVAAIDVVANAQDEKEEESRKDTSWSPSVPYTRDERLRSSTTVVMEYERENKSLLTEANVQAIESSSQRPVSPPQRGDYEEKYVEESGDRFKTEMKAAVIPEEYDSEDSEGGGLSPLAWCVICLGLAGLLFALGAGKVPIPNWLPSPCSGAVHALQHRFQAIYAQHGTIFGTHFTFVQFASAFSILSAALMTGMCACVCMVCSCGRDADAREPPEDDEFALPAPYRPLTG